MQKGATRSKMATFKAGGVGFQVRDVFQGVEIDGTCDVFPVEQLYPRRV
jgi:hypothetical protein